MKLPVFILPAAVEDVEKAICYYEDVRPGYGEVFRLEFDRTIGIVALWSEAYERVTERLRKAKVRHFAHVVVYRHLAQAIRIVGVISSRRDPEAVTLLDRQS